jgi:hypothetical protein
MDTRWVAYRDRVGRSPGSSLASGLPIGLGWRGVYLHGVYQLDDFDTIVLRASEQVDASLGVCHVEGGVTYGIAAAHEREPVRFLLNTDPMHGPSAASDAVARCAIGTSASRWRQHAGQALAAWSIHAPRTADPLECVAILEMREGDAVAALCEVLGMAVPVDRPLDPADEASRARAELAHAAERRRQRRQPDFTW